MQAAGAVVSAAGAADSHDLPSPHQEPLSHLLLGTVLPVSFHLPCQPLLLLLAQPPAFDQLCGAG